MRVAHLETAHETVQYACSSPIMRPNVSCKGMKTTTKLSILLLLLLVGMYMIV
jgi:hypothetical protein